MKVKYHFNIPSEQLADAAVIHKFVGLTNRTVLAAPVIRAGLSESPPRTIGCVCFYGPYLRRRDTIFVPVKRSLSLSPVKLYRDLHSSFSSGCSARFCFRRFADPAIGSISRGCREQCGQIPANASWHERDSFHGRGKFSDRLCSRTSSRFNLSFLNSSRSRRLPVGERMAGR